MVPVVDLSRRGRALAASFASAAARVCESGSILLGPETGAFEHEFASWLDVPHAVAVSSGASALQLALSALGVGVGDEVVVPAFTAVPTAAAVCAVGATPVFVDVERDTANLNASLVADVVTPRTKAVIAVHLYGRPATMPDVEIPIIEDAAQAHGAVADHARSAAVAYSFYPTKNLGGIGDGGAVTTNNVETAARVQLLRGHGLTHDYVHTEISQNFRMSEIEAAWLRLCLPRLDAGNARRREIAARYIEASPRLTWQATDARHSYHLAVARVSDRPTFRDSLAELGVGTAVHYPLALTQQPAYAQFVRDACPEAEAWAAECVSIPCFPELTDDEVDLVASALAKVAS